MSNLIEGGIVLNGHTTVAHPKNQIELSLIMQYCHRYAIPMRDENGPISEFFYEDKMYHPLIISKKNYRENLSDNSALVRFDNLFDYRKFLKECDYTRIECPIIELSMTQADGTVMNVTDGLKDLIADSPDELGIVDHVLMELPLSDDPQIERVEPELPKMDNSFYYKKIVEIFDPFCLLNPPHQKNIIS